MPTIAVLNQKGGAGKTTTSLGIADAIANLGFNVLLTDTDAKGSSLKWASVRQSPPKFAVMGMPHANIHKDLPPIAANYDFTVIDGFPKMDDIAKSSIMAADLVMIPIQPSPLDIWASEDTMKLVTDAQIYKPMLKCVFVITRKVKGTTLGNTVMEKLLEYGFPVMDTVLHQRVVYASSLVSGDTLSEADNDGDATAEVKALALETFEFMEWL